MKCPVCSASKAYRRRRRRWTDSLLSLMFITPMRCQHCFRSFVVFWPLRMREQLERPSRKEQHTT